MVVKSIVWNRKVMVYIILLILMSFSIPINVFGQNVIANSSFEEFTFCPKNYFRYPNVFNQCLNNWYSPTKGTPDYFNDCSRSRSGVPNNFAGVAEPLDGSGYVGFCLATNPSLIHANINFTQEYIATRLDYQLQKNKRYCIEFYISLADYSLYTINEIGIYFSKKKIKKRTTKNLPYKPQILFKCDHINNDRSWVKLSNVFIASGNEEFLAIGNFQKPYEIDYKKRNLCIRKNKILNNAYYYIDAVTIYPLSDNCNCGKNDFTL